MTTIRFIRLRAGFYVTEDAQWRIVRRAIWHGKGLVWHVEQWQPQERLYVRATTTGRLADARSFVKLAVRAYSEDV